ncbi:MAG TPA: MarR family transcriptional regulator [Pseudonocardia sp.]|uniref:MarR family winged helix-turn-helix transcriptional regulator n=1 Tax=Pseudonocardia sp. TaxID=60912 RepID=UPI002ED9C584
MAVALGVGVTEISALGELRQDGPLTPSELSRRLGLTSPSVTSLLDRLESAGLVVRQRHPADRRSVLVRLTGGADAALAAFFELFSDDVAAAVESSDPDHVAELATMLGSIAEAMSARANDRDSIARELAERVARYRSGSRPPDGPD